MPGVIASINANNKIEAGVEVKKAELRANSLYGRVKVNTNYNKPVYKFYIIVFEEGCQDETITVIDSAPAVIAAAKDQNKVISGSSIKSYFTNSSSEDKCKITGTWLYYLSRARLDNTPSRNDYAMTYSVDEASLDLTIQSFNGIGKAVLLSVSTPYGYSGNPYFSKQIHLASECVVSSLTKKSSDKVVI